MSFPENQFHEHTWVKDNPKIGDGTWIGPFCIIDGTGGLTIGKECDISAGTHIYTHSTVIRCVSGKKFLNNKINREAIETAPVSIGDNTFIGPHSVISSGVKIGNHVIVGANSFVNSDIPDFSIFAGSPAKKIGSVEMDANKNIKLHYYKESR